MAVAGSERFDVHGEIHLALLQRAYMVVEGAVEAFLPEEVGV